MGKRRHWVFSNVLDQILFILAGNDDMHEILDEFEIWPDSTKDYRVGCPCTPFTQLLPTRVCFTNAGVNTDGARIHKLGKHAV